MVIEALRSAALEFFRQHLPSTYGKDEGYLALLLAAGYDAAEIVSTEIYGDLKYSPWRPPPLTWAKLVALGLHPVKCTKRGIQYTVKRQTYGGGNDELSHPLQLAAMYGFLLNDTEAAALCVEEYVYTMRPAVADPKLRPHSGYCDEFYTMNRWSPMWVIPRGPQELGLRHIEFTGWMDNVHLGLWYTPKSIEEVVGSLGLTSDETIVAAEVSALLGNMWHARLHAVAAANAERYAVLKLHSRRSYRDTAKLLRLCTAEDATKILEKTEGVRQALRVVRHDATQSQMVSGLRAIAGMSDPREMLRLLGRCPTVEELAAVRSTAIVDIVRQLPEEYLDRLLPRLTPLRASLLKHVGANSLDRLRDCFVPHKDRVSRLPYSADTTEANLCQTRVGNVTRTSEWKPVFEWMAGQYRASQDLREKLVAATYGDPVIAAFVLAPVFEFDTPNLERLRKMHPNWDVIKGLLETAKEPSDSLKDFRAE